MSNTVRVASISHFVTVAESLGLDAKALLRQAGIDPGLLLQPETRFPAQSFAEALEAAAEAGRCPAFGLLISERRQVSDLGPVALIVSHQSTLSDMLATIIRYRRLMNGSLTIRAEQFGDLVVISQSVDAPGARSLRQGYELAVGGLHLLFHGQTKGRWRPLTVNFTHPPPPDLAIHRRVFGEACLEFGSGFNGFTCSRAQLDAPIPSAEPLLAEWAEAFVRTLPNAEPGPIADEVGAAVEALLPDGKASVARAAALLGLSTRTLQRRLAAEGEDYAGILNGARRRVALRHLANSGLPLIDVAALSGYSRQSSFSRWFAGEFEMSASEWRHLSDAPRARRMRRPGRPAASADQGFT